MFKSLIVSVLIVCAAISPVVSGPHAHVHGSATSTIVVSDGNIQAEVRIPAVSVVGFERRPSSENETRAIEEAKAMLSQPGLFRFYEDGGWFRWNQNLVLKREVADVDFYVEDHGHGVHAEFVVKYSCSVVVETGLAAFETTLFSLVPDLHELSLDIVTDTSKGHYEMSPHKIKITLGDH